MNIGKFLRVLIEHLQWWLLLGTVINQSKIFQEITASKFEWQHPAQLKRKSTADVCCRILGSFKAVTFKNTLWGLFLKRIRGGEIHGETCGFRFSLFPGQLLSKS